MVSSQLELSPGVSKIIASKFIDYVFIPQVTPLQVSYHYYKPEVATCLIPGMYNKIVNLRANIRLTIIIKKSSTTTVAILKNNVFHFLNLHLWRSVMVIKPNQMTHPKLKLKLVQLYNYLAGTREN